MVVRDAPNCPVCGEESVEVAEQVLVSTLDEEGNIIPGTPITSRRWFECPRGHGRLIEVTSYGDNEPRYAVSGPVAEPDVAHLHGNG